MSASAWEFVFMMLVLKLPILYLIGVVWWAVRAAPDPYEPAMLVSGRLEPEPNRPTPACTWRGGHRRRSPPGARTRVASVGVRR